MLLRPIAAPQKHTARPSAACVGRDRRRTRRHSGSTTFPIATMVTGGLWSVDGDGGPLGNLRVPRSEQRGRAERRKPCGDLHLLFLCQRTGALQPGSISFGHEIVPLEWPTHVGTVDGGPSRGAALKSKLSHISPDGSFGASAGTSQGCNPKSRRQNLTMLT
jgi:hypothetical protein